MVAHLGGEPCLVQLQEWLQLDVNEWDVAIASPGLDPKTLQADLSEFKLQDSQALLLVPRAAASATA